LTDGLESQPPMPGPIARTSKRGFARRATLLLVPASLNLGVAAILAPAVNAILARGENPEEAIGGYAVALGIIMLVALPQMRIQQMTLVFLDDGVSLARLRRFTATSALIVALLAAIVALTPIRDLVLQRVFSLSGVLESEARAALLALLPLPALAVARPHLYGCAIRLGHTRHVWAGTIVGMGTVILTALVLQLSGTVEGAAVGAFAVSAAALAEVLVMIWLTGPALRRELPSAPDDGAGTEYASMVRFFMPLLFAGFLATVTPPVINAAVARTSTPETSIAAIAIALSVSQFLTIILWGLQPTVLALLGQGHDPRQIRLFANAIGLLVMVLAMFFAFYPPATVFILRDLVGVEGRLFESAQLGMRIFAPLPLILAQEQIFSSALMRVRRTRRILYINLIRLASLIAFVLIGLNLVDAPGVVLGIGAIAFTLVVEAGATYVYGRSAMSALSSAWSNAAALTS
jgi:O-antigen/teichoic acid export membrane protein